MDLKLATGPIVKALGGLLPHQDQHDPSHIPTTKLHLAQIQEELVPSHPGPSTTVLEADENISLTEGRPSPARIQEYQNDREGIVETPNSYSTNPRWDQMDGDTPNTYSTDLDLPTPSSF